MAAKILQGTNQVSIKPINQVCNYLKPNDNTLKEKNHKIKYVESFDMKTFLLTYGTNLWNFYNLLEGK